MVIKLEFEVVIKNKNIGKAPEFIITINNHEVFYEDVVQKRVFGGPVRYLPQNNEAIRKILLSRNKIDPKFKELFIVMPDELKEFNEAKDDSELSQIVIKDAVNKGCRLLKVNGKEIGKEDGSVVA